ncbi:SDR family NAD(P)-dependent oxidoreductase [Kribbella sp. HUAS MG21]|uniref:SDR family NAD(P)-dependent oxidoreductase n=1 Tax=Kribbella sp. HUAS MG21 TaxID=3160966 RepID=A0AAU7T7N1_9ACTN
MPTIAIVGAGPGLGLSIDQLAGELTAAGIEAAGFAADVMDAVSIAAAFGRIKDRFGTIDVLEYSPAPHNPVPGLTNPGPLEVTVGNLQPQLDYYLYGGLAATDQVLPEMLERGSGTVLFSTGGSSMDPLAGPPEFTTTSIGSGALRTYALKLHQATAGTGVYVAHVPIFAWIGTGGPETQPDTIAQHYWNLHLTRDGAEQPYAAA